MKKYIAFSGRTTAKMHAAFAPYQANNKKKIGQQKQKGKKK